MAEHPEIKIELWNQPWDDYSTKIQALWASGDSTTIPDVAFLWPLVVTGSDEMRTIPIGLSYLVGQYATAWNLLMAGSVIALLPVLVIYLLAQKTFVQGITLTGMGGR